MSGFKEGPAAWIAAAAAVVIIPVTIAIGMSAQKEDMPVPSPTSRGEGVTLAPPAASESGSTGKDCVRGDGIQVDCGGADAWLVVSASPCDPESASRALGADPGEVELQIESKEIAEHCAVAPTDAARTAGATINDLTEIGEGKLTALVLTCWQAPDPRTAVPCNQPHRFEPTAQWRPLRDRGELQAVCSQAARRYVAGPVDSMSGALSSTWVVSQEREPRFRCLVESRDTLTGTVHRLSGRPLPTAASR